MTRRFKYQLILSLFLFTGVVSAYTNNLFASHLPPISDSLSTLFPDSNSTENLSISLPSMYNEKYRLDNNLTVSVFPIPTRTYLLFSAPNGSRVLNIEILDKKGRKVSSKSITTPSELELNRLKAGKYELRIFDKNNRSLINIEKLK